MDQEIKTVIQYPTGATEFDIPFDYLSRKFVRVSLVSDDNRRLLSNITEYRYVSKTRVRLLVDTSGFDRVEIRRFTSASERIVDFSDGSVLRAADLNVSQIQSAHIAEEARDAALMAMPQDDAGNLDARNRKIVRLAPGVDGTDAINKNQLDTTLGEAGGILSGIKGEKDQFYEYLEKFADDTTMIRGVTWVYNGGSAVGGETSIVINKPTAVFAVPYIEINGDRQEVGYQYDFNASTQTITLAKPLAAGDFLMAMTSESHLPLESLLAGTTGASSIGTKDGGNVQSALDNLGYYIVPPPAAPSSSGNTGDIAIDSGFLYVCVAFNTWKQVALSTF
ncbi:non-contractile tail fiber protein [Klebsiella phage Kpn17]|uniref:Probable tail spike protein n=1 Tax=Klebsiella phage Kpn17 TaxID=3044025 RepID=A0AAT9V638_9CAUD|nr:non-contractile tail fiber protein [Klebsiella phage Kpn17]